MLDCYAWEDLRSACMRELFTTAQLRESVSHGAASRRLRSEHRTVPLDAIFRASWSSRVPPSGPAPLSSPLAVECGLSGCISHAVLDAVQFCRICIQVPSWKLSS